MPAAGSGSNSPKGAVPTPVTAGERDVDLAAKLAYLRQPTAYPEGPRRVEALETHMSWVFLTDNYAYKLKKPVYRPFLDFSTVEARKINCEREVSLNRRLAPDVYLGTVALKLDPAGDLHLGGAGRTVDWLVKMRRLPVDRTLEHAILEGAIRREDIDRLAVRLAEFYRRASPVRIDPAEYRRRFERGVEDNRSELGRREFGLPRDLVEHGASVQQGFLADRGGLLEDRASSGRIIEGHGDLRPEHVYLGRDPIILDCLEFNRDFRILDPVDELAFLAMECERLGAGFVEHWLFGTYRDRTDDAWPPSLIDFYKCHRAYLRAKIAIWHLKEPDLQNPEKWVDRACQYLRLALGSGKRLGG